MNKTIVAFGAILPFSILGCLDVEEPPSSRHPGLPEGAAVEQMVLDGSPQRSIDEEEPVGTAVGQFYWLGPPSVHGRTTDQDEPVGTAVGQFYWLGPPSVHGRATDEETPVDVVDTAAFESHGIVAPVVEKIR